MVLGPLQLSAEVNVFKNRKGEFTSVNIESIAQKAQREVP